MAHQEQTEGTEAKKFIITVGVALSHDPKITLESKSRPKAAPTIKGSICPFLF